ncbi:MAG: hypothetical protein J2P35_20765, partial [Actinobacteria bacterium]|nr:hypothetical protein [Actinomycetota bacterium]
KAARAWPAVPREPRLRAPLPGAPALPGSVVPARGPNGQQRAEQGTALPPAARSRQPRKS